MLGLTSRRGKMPNVAMWKNSSWACCDVGLNVTTLEKHASLEHRNVGLNVANVVTLEKHPL